jgi:hypothetical protein
MSHTTFFTTAHLVIPGIKNADDVATLLIEKCPNGWPEEFDTESELRDQLIPYLEANADGEVTVTVESESDEGNWSNEWFEEITDILRQEMAGVMRCNWSSWDSRGGSSSGTDCYSKTEYLGSGDDLIATLLELVEGVGSLSELKRIVEAESRKIDAKNSTTGKAILGRIKYLSLCNKASRRIVPLLKKYDGQIVTDKLLDQLTEDLGNKVFYAVPYLRVELRDGSEHCILLGSHPVSKVPVIDSSVVKVNPPGGFDGWYREEMVEKIERMILNYKEHRKKIMDGLSSHPCLTSILSAHGILR